MAHNEARQPEADAAQRLDVLLHGAYFCDLIFGGLPEVPQLGRDLFSSSFDITPGGAYYTALALHRLGLRTGWMCEVGDDMFSRAIEEAALAEGIDTSYFERSAGDVRRLAAVFSFAHDRGFISYIDGRLPDILPLDEVIRLRPRCLLLTNIGYWQDLPRLSSLPDRSETLVYMDCQDSGLSLDTPDLVDCLRHVDVFAPNEAEALHLTGAHTAREALRQLADFIPAVVIKCGMRGSIAQRGDEVVEAAPIAVTAVDTTGAGDCFNAGCVYGLLKDAPLVDCLRYGNIMGGLSTTGPGGKNVPEHVPDLSAFYDQTAQYERQTQAAIPRNRD
jgi:sugar/nucleoside kinase (ribokinase family)